MDKMKIARIFEEIADLLEMKGVKYKPQAYRKAARSIRDLSQDIEKLKEQEKLQEIPGVGEAIGKKISELIETDSLDYYEKLKKEFDMDYEALLSVEGLGPKTVKKLYDKIGIKDLDDLEKAAKKQKIRKLEGFGEKSEKKILERLKFAKKRGNRKLLGYILPLAKQIKKRIGELEQVEKIELAGSIRRRKATIGDIDVLVVSKKPKKVMDFFTSMEDVIEIIAKGESKSTVRLEQGIEADLRVLKKKSFGAGLLYFTGSKRTNIEMRKVAQKKGWKLNEYGLFENQEMLAGKTEKQVFNKLGMQFIPPEMRENRGEVGAALNKKIPELIKYDDIRGDLQMHTKWSDGSHSIKEMAQAAKKIGHEYIAITDHTGGLGIAGGMDAKEMRKQMKKIEKINKKIKGIEILKGAEVNIDSKGKLDMKNSVLRDLDVVVASIHTGFRQSKEKLTNRIISAMENEYVNIIAHPTGRKIQKREGYKLDFEKIFQKSKQTNTFLEINSYPARLDLSDVHIKNALESGCKLSINTDSHTTGQLKFMELGIAMARRGWARKKHIINTLPLEKLRKVLEK